ncbi:MAG: LLM class flavin-dependent oxidoreductase [bacterium]|jgi:alkanesulfonate monooxygenase SsuD/methylene tetrahydromethanopterin reductase-like flavin-dependent oxidoreductase (luciferase family)|nr:LLM class flavin-dependent oxidoreductase [Candidatus Aquidulcis sp.]
MQIAVVIEGQMNLSYADQLAAARRAEAVGLSGFYRTDHYESFPGPSDQATTDAWSILAGIARETRSIPLGTLVSPVTFRAPGAFAKIVATIQEMAGRQIHAGLGTGWHESEHRRYGFPFPAMATRAEMLEEQLQIVRGLWSGPDGWSFSGSHYQVSDALFRPKPVPLPWVITGGEGSPRGMRIAARFSDEFNLTSSAPSTAREKFAQLDAACDAAGRAPGSLVRSAMTGALIGRSEVEYQEKLRAFMSRIGAVGDPESYLAPRRARWLVGTPDQALAQMRAFQDAGANRLLVQHMDPTETSSIDLLAELQAQL